VRSNGSIESMSLYPERPSRNSRPIAVFDIETTTDLQRVYLVGFFDGANYRYWESKPLHPANSRSALALFLEWYLGEPRPYWLYSHNGGNFDNVFVLAWLLAQPTSRFSAEIIPVNSCMLRLRLLDVHDPDTHWDFLDSFRLLPASLNALAKTFLGEQKVDIQHDYENLIRNPKRYEYLEGDCTLLFRVLTMFKAKLEEEIGGRLSLSTAACALKTFQQSFQEEVLFSASPNSDRLARAAYYGGRCEVFHK
jgi:hypothetical protein